MYAVMKSEIEPDGILPINYVYTAYILHQVVIFNIPRKSLIISVMGSWGKGWLNSVYTLGEVLVLFSQFRLEIIFVGDF